jgi:hypothetical protein
METPRDIAKFNFNFMAYQMIHNYNYHGVSASEDLRVGKFKRDDSAHTIYVRMYEKLELFIDHHNKPSKREQQELQLMIDKIMEISSKYFKLPNQQEATIGEFVNL